MPYSPALRTSLVSVLVVYFSCHLLAYAKTVSRIIDDTYGDEATGYLPVYYPQDNWVWKHNCNTGQGCTIVPDDENRIQNKTWTAATYRTNMTNMGLTLQFDGTAISVYFILTNDIGKNNTRNTECKFTLDGTSYQFVHEPTSEKGFNYNYEAYRAIALDNKHHMLEITTGELGHEAYISFDYARYTTEISDDPNSTTAAESKKTSASVGVIVGAVVGGVGLLCIVVFTSLLILRRKTRSPSRPHDTIPEPYPLNQPPEMNQIEEMRKPLRTRKRGNVNVSGFGEQMGQMQAQLNSLQTQSRVQPSEPPPSYNIFTSYEDPSLSEYPNDIHQQPRIGR